MNWFTRKPQFSSWDEFWAAFQTLCEHCDPAVATELKDAQGYVNGLTDGWHDFRDALQRVESHHGDTFDELTKKTLANLLHDLGWMLSHR